MAWGRAAHTCPRYKGKDFVGALAHYGRALEAALSDEERGTLHRNMAAVHLKLEQWDAAVKAADGAVAVSAGDIKALFRRAQANEALGNNEAAFEDARKVPLLRGAMRGGG